MILRRGNLLGTLLEVLLVHSKKRQAPKLPNVALSWYKSTKRFISKAVVVRPAPHLATQLRSVVVDQSPQVIVRSEYFLVQSLICAEVCLKLVLSERGVGYIYPAFRSAHTFPTDALSLRRSWLIASPRLPYRDSRNE
jgi:hypothetical protein